jgi:fucose permease
MISIILLVLIYLTFISLGLPDSILGVSWPVIREEMNLPLDRAGPIAFATTASTVLSSLLSAYIIKHFGTGKLVFLSSLMTAIALIGYSLVPSYYWLIIIAVPLGFGGGSVDTALNNYVALHFKAHHMNWLHSFWAVGTTISPLIMSMYLTVETSWRSGYRTIGLMQLCLAIVLFLTLPIWKMHRDGYISSYNTNDSIDTAKFTEYKAFNIPGVKHSLWIFISYCTIEGAVGLWGSSYFIETKNIAADTAATWIALYYGGIALGRFFSGFFAFKLASTTMIRIGINTLTIGVVMMLLPLSGLLSLITLTLIGFGLSPIFPAMIHETPHRFGGLHAPTIIGYQMAAANIGFAFFVPLTGFILDNTAMKVFPFLLFFLIVIIYFCAARLKKIYKERVN